MGGSKCGESRKHKVCQVGITSLLHKSEPCRETNEQTQQKRCQNWQTEAPRRESHFHYSLRISKGANCFTQRSASNTNIQIPMYVCKIIHWCIVYCLFLHLAIEMSTNGKNRPPKKKKQIDACAKLQNFAKLQHRRKANCWEERDCLFAVRSADVTKLRETSILASFWYFNSRIFWHLKTRFYFCF